MGRGVGRRTKDGQVEGDGELKDWKKRGVESRAWSTPAESRVAAPVTVAGEYFRRILDTDKIQLNYRVNEVVEGIITQCMQKR